MGIITDPRPPHPMPTDGAGWQALKLHTLTRDFRQICRYRAQNAEIIGAVRPGRLVFIGDSITDSWVGVVPLLFKGGLIDLGISGQMTPQMLVRFREDVIAFRPRAVHITVGTNDIAGNTGATMMAFVQGNIESMTELARVHGIKVILASTPPAAGFPRSPDSGRCPTTGCAAMPAQRPYLC